MKPRVLLTMLLIACLVLAMSGCDATLYESLPVGNTATCDPAFQGRWKLLDPSNQKHDENTLIEFNADCTDITTISSGGVEHENLKTNFVFTRAGNFLWVSDNDRKPDCSPDLKHCGFELVRYAPTGDTIRLYRSDHRKVHDALESHVVSGYTEMSTDPQTTATNGTQAGQPPVPADLIAARTSAASDKQQPTYHNLIAGRPDQITTILKEHPEFFEQEPWLILVRDDGTQDKGQQQ